MQSQSDRWISVGLALALHAALLGALVYGWMLFRSPPHPMPTLAIEATVIDARVVAAAPRPAPPPPVPQESPPEPQGPPPPSPEEQAQREQQRQQQEKETAEAAAAQQAAEEKAQAKAAEEERAAEAKRKAAETKAAQEKKAQEAKEKAEEAQEEAEREADLQRSLASEERTAAASSGPALASWQARIAAQINRAWLRPPTARPGIQCMLSVTQEPGGVVTQVSIGACNGDQAVRESIEAAVYRASPLPPPPDPALFDRNLKINFKPD
jgi:colicin import membrane protein